MHTAQNLVEKSLELQKLLEMSTFYIASLFGSAPKHDAFELGCCHSLDHFSKNYREQFDINSFVIKKS